MLGTVTSPSKPRAASRKITLTAFASSVMPCAVCRAELPWSPDAATGSDDSSSMNDWLIRASVISPFRFPEIATA